MQVIRLSRVGRRNQSAFRIVLAEKSDAVNRKFQEVLGMYNVSEGKKLNFDAARIEHWIKMGAIPSDSVASLLKNAGVPGMEKFIAPRTLQRKTKNPVDEPVVATVAPTEETPAPEEEAPAEITPAEPAEAPAEEAAPSEEAPASEEEEKSE